MRKILKIALLSCLGGGAITSPILADELMDGAYLTTAAGCLACHTEKGSTGQEFAGGHALKTPFGVFFTPNITGDMETGIGNWTEQDFVQALKKGQRPDGSHYFPAFPYTSYTNMTDTDVKLIFGYLKSLPAIKKENKAHSLGMPFSWRWLQWGWKVLFFDESDGTIPVIRTKIDRGQYLVDALSHCGECHTPRNMLGGTDKSLYLAGSAGGGGRELVSNITPDMATGIGEWSESDIVSFLENGMKPDFDNVQGSMEDVIEHGTSKMTKDDREAIAAYLISIRAITNKIGK